MGRCELLERVSRRTPELRLLGNSFSKLWKLFGRRSGRLSEGRLVSCSEGRSGKLFGRRSGKLFGRRSGKLLGHSLVSCSKAARRLLESATQLLRSAAREKPF